MSEGSPAATGVGEPEATGPDGARSGSRSRHRQLAVETAVLLGVAVVIAVVLRAFFGQAFFIPSASMTPQLEVGDRVVVSKLSYRLHDPRRGDVVVFDCPPRSRCPEPDADTNVVVRGLRVTLEAVGLRQPSTSDFIKRVIALPGEQVEGREGSVWIDGFRLVEPYLPEGTRTSDFDPVTLPDGTVWVMGDNRTGSSDSRSFGPVDTDTIVGRAVWRVWPPLRVAFL
ncbi:MAG TPA: signal peptidase I [Acidimicrobiales bacterium]|nr:signal peptidase I [Acidimicrobiales bacterium]